MPYMMAGYPDRETSLAVAEAYVDSGADLIELGVPFSDPLADGPTIHAAATAALEAGATFATALEVCRSVAERVPVVLMVYANMVLAHGGAAEFARLRGRRRRRRGDRPRPAARRGRGGARGLRRRRAGAGAAGRADDPGRAARADLRRRPRLRLRRLHGRNHRRARRGAGGAGRAGRARPRPTPRSPVAVGFGIGTAEQAAEVGRIADGVIVGSRLVRAAGEARLPAGRRRRGRRLPQRGARRPRRIGSAPHGNGRHPLPGARRDDGLLRLRAGRPGRRPGLLHGAPDRRRDPRPAAAA